MIKEYHLHVASVRHIRRAFPHLMMWHTPNQNKDATQAFFNKEMGVKPGVSDLIFAWDHTTLPIGHTFPRPVMMGGIELKLPKQKESPAQNSFRSVVKNMGWHYAICRSVKEVHDAIKSWGHIPVTEFITEPYDKKEMSKQWTDLLYKRPEK